MGKTSSYFFSVVLLALALGMFVTDKSSSRLALQKGALLEERLANQRLSTEVKQLTKDTYELYHQPEAIEKFLREEHAYSRPGEKVVFFNH